MMINVFNRLSKKWSDISLAAKLYFVVGMMALLITCELFTLLFAMNTLSAVRAFVGGEGLWSKSQKMAIYNLGKYGLTGEEVYFETYKSFLSVPKGDRLARKSMEAQPPNMEMATEGFAQGHINREDIPGLIRLFTSFNQAPHLAKAIQIWRAADDEIQQVERLGEELHSEVLTGAPRKEKVRDILDRLDISNDKLTVLEDDFSYTLGEGSRWLEHLLKLSLVFAVLLVESTGLLLTASVTRNLSGSLKEINEYAAKVGRGIFDSPLPVRSRNELGQLAQSLNKMSADLEKSLVARLQTEKMEQALQIRDEFLFLASHELNTPLTSLKMQLQMAQKSLENDIEKLPKQIDISLRQVGRLTNLVSDLLDVSRVRSGKLNFHFESVNLGDTIKEVVDRYSAQLAEVGCSVEFDIKDNILGFWDVARIEQVVVNLISNIIKYAPGGPIRISVDQKDEGAVFSVEDSGPGIDFSQREKVFERFERSTKKNVSGLGLGLFIVKQIVAAHNGEVKVDNSLGHGARFVVQLPLDPRNPMTASH